MSNEKTEEFEETLDLDSEEFEDGDYGFIINSHGELKSLLLPEDLMEMPPLQVRKILKIFGIKNIHELEPRTLH